MKSTKSKILNKTNIGKIKSILAKVGFITLKALLTVAITELVGSASGNNPNILIKIVSIKLSIFYSLSVNK